MTAQGKRIHRTARGFLQGVLPGQHAKHRGRKVLRAAERSPDEGNAESGKVAGLPKGADSGLVRHVEAVLGMEPLRQPEGEPVPVTVRRIVVVEVHRFLLHGAELRIRLGRIEHDVVR